MAVLGIILAYPRMPNRKKHQDSSVVAFSLRSLLLEIRGWRFIIRTEWPLLLLLVFGVALLLFVSSPIPPRDVYLAVGQRDSSFEHLGKKFQPYFEKEGITLHLVYTNGYSDSMKALQRPDSKVTAAFSLAGIASKGSYPGIETLGSIEYVPLWLFHQGEKLDVSSALNTLVNKKISIGPLGSGSDLLTEKLLSLSDINIRDNSNVLHLSNAEATQALIDGDIFAMFIADAENSPNLQRLLKNEHIQIFNFEYAQAISKKLPVLHPVILPKGALDLKQRRPAKDINLLATTATLLIKKDMHPAIQHIFMSSAEYISRSLEPMFNDPDFFPAYLDHNVPLSSIAARYYDKGPPILEGKLPFWLVSYLDKIWLILVGAFAIIFPLFRLFPNYRRARTILVVSNAFIDLRHIEREAEFTTDLGTLRGLIERINEMHKETLTESVPVNEMSRLYAFKGALNTVRQLINNKIKELEK